MSSPWCENKTGRRSSEAGRVRLWICRAVGQAALSDQFRRPLLSDAGHLDEDVLRALARDRLSVLEAVVGGVQQVERRALPSFLQTGWSRSRSASSSRVPLRKSIGTVTAPRCSARFVSGLPGWWSGNAKKTRPSTPSRGDSEAAVGGHAPAEGVAAGQEARSARRLARAAATAARTVAVQTACESRPLPCSM